MLARGSSRAGVHELSFDASDPWTRGVSAHEMYRARTNRGSGYAWFRPNLDEWFADLARPRFPAGVQASSRSANLPELDCDDAQNATTERSPERPGGSAISAHMRSWSRHTERRFWRGLRSRVARYGALFGAPCRCRYQGLDLCGRVAVGRRGRACSVQYEYAEADALRLPKVDRRLGDPHPGPSLNARVAGTQRPRVGNRPCPQLAR